jgi:Putative peptidoglycan binding domain
MAGYRKPKPLGVGSPEDDVRDGTLCCQTSAQPGPLDREPLSHGHTRRALPHRSHSLHKPLASLASHTKPKRLPLLREGSRGTEVAKLQRLLNSRLSPSPSLAVDGIFGPLTREAVLRLQRAKSLAADGIVGKMTWYHLLASTQVISVLAVTPTQPGAFPNGLASGNTRAAGFPRNRVATPSPSDVSVWSLDAKFTAVLQRTAPKLPGEIRREFEAFLSPGSLAAMTGTLALWAIGHACGASEVTDVALLLVGLYFLGTAVFDVAGSLERFLVTTVSADTEAELEEAATYLAHVITIIGVMTFLALLHKIRGRGRAAKTEPSTLEQEGVPEARSRPAASQTITQQPSRTRFSGARELKIDDWDGAERVYNEIRQSSTDVKAIARNTGINEARVARIKDHLFNRTHQLDDSIRRFDADPEIANAWRRLESGTHTQKDIQLLEHEIFESKFEGIFKTDYRTAHGAANRSGRPSGLE